MEVDWEVGVLAGDLVGEEQQGAAGVDLAVGECLAVVDRAAPDARVAAAARTSRWSTWIPAPRHRSREQQNLAASRMRDAKSRRHDKSNRTKENVEGALEKLRTAGMLRDQSKSKVVCSEKKLTCHQHSRARCFNLFARHHDAQHCVLSYAQALGRG